MGVRYVQETAPAAEPVTLAEAKAYMRITFSDDNDFIEDTLIPAARRAVESFLNRSLINQSWTAYFDCFPGYAGALRLSKGPVTDITSIKYKLNGNLVTLDSSKYEQKAGKGLCEIEPAYNQSWPTSDSILQSVEVAFDAGYGADGAAVPEDIRVGILYVVSHLYNNRNIVTFGANAIKVPYTGKDILRPYRIDRL